MHAETYTRILSYFQYICKLFDFKFLQKKKKRKKTFWESRKFSESFILYFLHINIYLIAILYYYILSDLYIIAEDVTFISL